jgi:hypothetical protein
LVGLAGSSTSSTSSKRLGDCQPWETQAVDFLTRYRFRDHQEASQHRSWRHAGRRHPLHPSQLPSRNRKPANL